MSKDSDKFEWLDSNGELNEAIFRESTFPRDYKGEIYVTPDWIRHPEKYPEIIDRMKEFGEWWSEELKKESKK